MTDTQQPLRVEQDGGTANVNEKSSRQAATITEPPSTNVLQSQPSSAPLNLAPEQYQSAANLENGINGASPSQHNSSTTTERFDPKFTQNVINATGPKASPRIRKVVGSLIQHVHDFARENEITVDEWMAGVEMVCFLRRSWKRLD